MSNPSASAPSFLLDSDLGATKLDSAIATLETFTPARFPDLEPEAYEMARSILEVLRHAQDRISDWGNGGVPGRCEVRVVEEGLTRCRSMIREWKSIAWRRGSPVPGSKCS